jgi:hypothetical protein
MKKKIKHFLEQYDGIWSFPAAVFAFWFVGMLLPGLFGFATGVYDMAFIQPLFLALAVVVFAVNASVVGLYFTFRGIFRFFYGYRLQNGFIKNHSKELWKQLPIVWQYGYAFLLFAFMAVLVIVVYLHLI